MIDMQVLKERAADRLRAGRDPGGVANAASRLAASLCTTTEISRLARLATAQESPQAKPTADGRPYRLSPADAGAAHGEPWDDSAIAQFVSRVRVVRRLGFRAVDADDLAERLHLRDLHADHRTLCLECRGLAGTVATGWRCGNHIAADVARELPAELVTTFQVCPGFKPAR